MTDPKFAPRPHQIEDACLLAARGEGGGILAQEQGLGKTLTSLLWARLVLSGNGAETPGAPAPAPGADPTRRNGPACVVIAPGDLLGAWEAELARAFGPCGEPALPGWADRPGAAIARRAAGIDWIFCDYLALGLRGADSSRRPSAAALRRRRYEFRRLALGLDHDAASLPHKGQSPWQILDIPNGEPDRSKIENAAFRRMLFASDRLNPGCPRARRARDLIAGAAGALGVRPPREYRDAEADAILAAIAPAHRFPSLAAAEACIGETREGITCLWRPALADELNALLAGRPVAAICDEAVRLKNGEATHAGFGAFRLRAGFRLALTGTPVKDRTPDLFWLAAWASPGSWPWAADGNGFAEFARRHLCREVRTTDAGAPAGNDAQRPNRRRKIRRRAPEVCDAPGIWRALAPILVRRRKRDCPGVVGRSVRRIDLPADAAMRQACADALALPAKPGQSAMAAAGRRLAALRAAALPAAPSPKAAYIIEAARRREPLVVFSPFLAFLGYLEHILPRGTAARMDGQAAPDKAERGRRSAAFRRGEFQVALCGIDAMGEGHSWPHCRRLILAGLHTAYDKNAQAIERVHRLDSPHPPEIEILCCEGTADAALYDLFRAKEAAAEAALSPEGWLDPAPDPPADPLALLDTITHQP